MLCKHKKLYEVLHGGEKAVKVDRPGFKFQPCRLLVGRPDPSCGTLFHRVVVRIQDLKTCKALLMASRIQ